MNTTNDKMETHYDLNTLGKAEVGKHYKDYKHSQQKKPAKVAINIQLDEDIIDAFKANGKDWQIILNNILRESLIKGF